MALVDSKASFKQRCDDIGGDTLHVALKAQGFETFAGLAYSCGSPKELPSQVDMDAFAAKVLGASPKLGDVALLKRLLFESSTFVVASLRQAVLGDTETPKRLPAAEKQARAEAQRTKLGGVVIERDMAPSYALVDLCAHMADTNVANWIAPGKCSSREAEIQVSSKDQAKVFRLEDQQLKVAGEPHEVSADCSSAISLQWCWQRRGLALNQCNLLTWESHERWVRHLLQALTKEGPPGWHKPSLHQIIQTDREAFLIMASELSTLKPDSSGALPMGTKLDALRHDPRIIAMLMPTPFKQPGQQAVMPDAGDSEPLSRAAKRRKRQKAARDGKKSDGGSDSKRTMPPELKDLFQKLEDGKPLCWDFNAKCGCQKKTEGQPPRCTFGVHGCMFCRRIGHSFQQCRARNWKGGQKGKGNGGKGNIAE